MLDTIFKRSKLEISINDKVLQFASCYAFKGQHNKNIDMSGNIMGKQRVGIKKYFHIFMGIIVTIRIELESV